MRKLRWDASEIKTYQEFFTKEDFVQINNYTRRPQWGYGNISNPGEPSAPFFTMPLMKDEFFTGHCMDVIQNKLNQKFKLNDVYCNGHIFGTQGSPHQDSGRDEDFTLLLYSNLIGKDIKKWKPQWGGKTVFFLTKDELTYVLPNPNTATIFPANIFHYAESTTRHFEGLRLSLAWKLSKV